MPVTVVCEHPDVKGLPIVDMWNRVRRVAGISDEEVVLQCVSEEEIKKLNKDFRQKDSATNILSFSYSDGTHDLALSIDVAMREAGELGATLRDYLAWLVVHGMLHVAGWDHERSEEEAAKTREEEGRILNEFDFKTYEQ